MTDPNKASNVCEVIVPNDLCIGCGTCAGVCPVSCLEMRMGEHAEYNPVVVGKCIQCGLCLQVCPFELTGKANEDVIAEKLFYGKDGVEHRPEVGYYQRCYAARLTSAERLAKRSSGGIGTWLLAKLLERNIVQHVFCVVPDADPAKRAVFAHLRSPEQVWQASRSYYGPVEQSAAIAAIRHLDGKVAVIGLPCFLKGLRRAAMADPRIAERLEVLVGLVCGQLKGRWFGDYLIRLGGLEEQKVSRICFRYKDNQRPAYELIFAAWTRDGSAEPTKLHLSEGYGYAWGRDYFKINACNYCDDTFAELADVSLMDAWLPKYAGQTCGQSLVIARTRQMAELLEEGAANGELLLEPENVQTVIQSQAAVVHFKRELLACRLDLAARQGLTVPAKRVQPRPAGMLATAGIRLRLKAARLSKDAFYRQKSQGPGLATFNQVMAAVRRRDIILRLVRQFYSLPGRALRKALRILFQRPC